jgi:hypothetical protein
MHDGLLASQIAVRAMIGSWSPKDLIEPQVMQRMNGRCGCSTRTREVRIRGRMGQVLVSPAR